MMKNDNKLYYLFIIIFLSLTVLIGCERKKEYYDTYNDAKKSGIIDKGWFPQYIPENASNITLEYDIDTNEVCSMFNYFSINFSMSYEIVQANGSDIDIFRNVLKNSRCFDDGIKSMIIISKIYKINSGYYIIRDENKVGYYISN